MDDARIAERVRTATVAGLRHRGSSVRGGEVLEIDGLVLSLTNLPDASLNSSCVEREPRDPRGALADAEAEFRARGLPGFGIELEAGVHPTMERAVRNAGLVRLFTRPALASRIEGISAVRPPDGIDLRPVRSERDLEGMRSVEVEAFGTAVEVAEGLIGRALLDRPDAWPWLARDGGRPVGESVGLLLTGTVGVFGVGVVEVARGRGIGAALTSAAVRSFPDADLAWLVPSELADPLYRRLGFRPVSVWEVWVRPARS